MAPKPKRTPHVELRESELPQPLRIIKQRGQTVAGCSATREIEYLRRGTSDGSEESRGSPPLTVDRPLTVHKRRAGRGSVLNGSFDEPTLPSTSSAIFDLTQKKLRNVTCEDPDLTPKARQFSRTASAGKFIKSELYSQWGRKQSDNFLGRIQVSQLDGQSTQTLAPEIPERRPSKSKTFLFKLGHWKDRAPRAMKRVESTTSKNTLLRRISHSSNQEVSSDSLGTSPITSEDRSYPLQHIKSRDITDDEIDSRTSSCGSISMHSLNPGHVGNWSSSIRDECLLCPEIRITPEISSLDAGSTNLWVAVEVTGVLRLVNDYEQNPPKLQEGRRVMSGYSAAHLRKFGCLQSMRIELITTRDASVLEVIGNLHESKSIYVGETHLILAKLRVAKVTRGTSHIRESSSSEEIMADLENHLGRAVTSYLTVRLTYKHSGFLNYKTVAINWEGGTSSHTTKLQTEASAFIKRHNLESAWSPRTSREINTPLGVNPLIKLMEMHLPSDRARGAIRRLADDRVPIPFARRLQNSSDAAGSSEDTVKVSLGCIVAERINSAVSMEILPMQSSNLPSVASEAQPFAPQLSHVVSAANETDPARQIWSQMRKNSRGHHNYRTSISDGHYSNDSDDCSPSHLSSPDTIDEERMKIKDMALRNKRSVGADTLKSFAPSIGKGRSGTIGGVGLGVGRNWWVGSNWW